MRYWDSSAVIPLIIEEAESARTRTLFEADPDVASWCLTPVEVWSGLARRRREGKLGSPDLRRHRAHLASMSAAWAQVQDSVAVRARALRLLDTHPLRAGDAIQIAAALVFTEDRPEECPFVTLDDRLAEAAEIEGFTVLPGFGT